MKNNYFKIICAVFFLGFLQIINLQAQIKNTSDLRSASSGLVWKTPSLTLMPIEQVSAGTYVLHNQCSDKVVEVSGSSKDNGASVQLWTSNGGANQQWKIEDAGNGYYTLENRNSGKLIDVYKNQTSNGTLVIQWTRHSGDNQLWQIVDIGGGFYKFLPKNASGKALDVSGASAADGARIQIWTDNGTCAQKWRLELVNPQVGVLAKSTAAFIATLGANVGVASWAADYETVTKPRLLELGIKHARVGIGIYPDRKSSDIDFVRCRNLVANGIKVTLLASALPTSWNGYTATDPQKITDAFDWCNGGLVAVEGINEPDLQNVSDWVARTRADQQALYNKVKSTPRMSNVKVLGPSPVSLGDRANEQLGNLSAYMDYGNMHTYYGNRNPGTRGWGAEFYGYAYGSLGYNRGFSAVVSGNKPIIATETGYSTKIDQATGKIAISESVKSQYLLRTYLHHFKEGVPRTFIYTLVNGNANDPYNYEAHFGLTMDDGTRNGSFYAIKNMIGLLRDDGATFTPSRLNYSVENATTDVEQVLLQKSDGRFYLAIWLEKQTWNPDTFEAIPVNPQDVALRLPISIKRATQHQIKSNGDLQSDVVSISNNSLTVRVSEKVKFIELSQ